MKGEEKGEEVVVVEEADVAVVEEVEDGIVDGIVDWIVDGFEGEGGKEGTFGGV